MVGDYKIQQHEPGSNLTKALLFLFYYFLAVLLSLLICETLENLVRVLQVHYENGLCTPPLVG